MFGEETIPREKKYKIYWPVAFTLLAGLGVTLLGFYLIRLWQYHSLQEKFLLSAELQCVDPIENALKRSTQTLDTVRNFYDASKNVSRKEFKEFTGDSLRQNTTMGAIFWHPRIPRNQKKRFERSVQKRIPGYHISPFPNSKSGESSTRGESPNQNLQMYFPILYSQISSSFDTEMFPAGADLNTHPHAKRTLRKALNTGGSYLSQIKPVPRKTQGSEMKPELGFYLIVPVYQNHFSARDVENEPGTISGVLTGVVSLSEKVEIFLSQNGRSNFSVTIKSAPNGNKNVFHYSGGKPFSLSGIFSSPSRESFYLKRTIQVMNQTLEIEVKPTNEFVSGQHASLGWIAIFLGGVLTLMFTRFSFEWSGTFETKERRLQQMTEHIDEVFWLTSPDFSNILYVSSSYETVWERSIDNLLEHPASWKRAVIKPDQEIIDKLIEVAPDKSISVEYRIRLPNGAIRWIRDRRFPVRTGTSSSSPSRIAGVCRDITEEKEMIHELKMFQHTASHDLRAPVRRILNYLDFLKQDLQKKDEKLLKEDINFVEESARRLDVMLNGMRRLSKIEEEEPRLEHTDLEECLNDALQNLSPDQVYIDNLKRDPLPEIYVDRSLIMLLFQNLLQNAFRHANSEEPVVAITCRKRDDKIIIGVKDNGQGIHPDRQEEIFTPFSSEIANDQEQGTGLGLSISREIVRAHGGKIWVDSKPGEGAHFQFLLPVEASREE